MSVVNSKRSTTNDQLNTTTNEFETTVGFVFDGTIYRDVLAELQKKCYDPTEEVVDVYAGPDQSQRYRETTRRFDRQWDLKRTYKCQETQVPYVDATTKTVIFICSTYKESTERALNADEWKINVQENHMTGSCARVGNKHRFCFDRVRFTNNIPFTRISCGEMSTYGGTLEARSKCNTLYYMEIEKETEQRLDVRTVRYTSASLVVLLFQLVPFDLVFSSMVAFNSCSIQRERIDNLFDAFKRQFVDFNSCHQQLAGAAESAALFLMPKWDGVRATGLYFCEGYLLMRNAREIMTAFRVKLPFANDMIIQLEQVDTTADGSSFYVVTELLAVLTKSHNTMYQVFGQNNAKHDTGRCIGNVATSITIKRQFKNHQDICNSYRLIDAETSLRVMSVIGRLNGYGPIADSPKIILTRVVEINCTENAAMLRRVGNFVSCTSGDGQSIKRHQLDKLFDEFFDGLRLDSSVAPHCEGLIMAYSRLWPNPAYGYFKLKYVDTIDLEFNVTNFTFCSKDGTFYTVEATDRSSLSAWEGWCDNRIVVECMYDFDAERLVFVRKRYDKMKPDTDKKIKAINTKIFEKCIVETNISIT